MIRQRCHYVPKDKILPLEGGLNALIALLFLECNCVEIKQIIPNNGYILILYSYEDKEND